MTALVPVVTEAIGHASGSDLPDVRALIGIGFASQAIRAAILRDTVNPGGTTQPAARAQVNVQPPSPTPPNVPNPPPRPSTANDGQTVSGNKKQTKAVQVTETETKAPAPADTVEPANAEPAQEPKSPKPARPAI